jgi:hypothetical protein
LRNYISVFALSIVLFGCSIAPEKSSVPGCIISKWGLVSLETADYFRSEENSFSGYGLVHDGIMITEITNEIPLKFGVSFGVQHRFSNVPDGDLIKKTIVHPKFIKKDGSTSVSETHFMEPSDVGSSWVINREWELVSGDWEFLFEHNGKLLCSKKFKTI